MGHYSGREVFWREEQNKLSFERRNGRLVLSRLIESDVVLDMFPIGRHGAGREDNSGGEGDGNQAWRRPGGCNSGVVTLFLSLALCNYYNCITVR